PAIRPAPVRPLCSVHPRRVCVHSYPQTVPALYPVLFLLHPPDGKYPEPGFSLSSDIPTCSDCGGTFPHVPFYLRKHSPDRRNIPLVMYHTYRRSPMLFWLILWRE